MIRRFLECPPRKYWTIENRNFRTFSRYRVRPTFGSEPGDEQANRAAFAAIGGEPSVLTRSVCGRLRLPVNNDWRGFYVNLAETPPTHTHTHKRFLDVSFVDGATSHDSSNGAGQ